VAPALISELLGRIVEITGVASLTANVPLVNNNARLGARVAQEYAALEPRR
jgi:pseudouridylate synthase